MKYFVKTPWWVKKLYPFYIWEIKTDKKILYLTFDDGPHPVATPFVLDVLREYNAKASFFCLGKNVRAFPHIYQRIKNEGHSVGNHTYNHLNGWKTSTEDYLNDVTETVSVIDSYLFRPPYGRIKRAQARRIKKAMNSAKAKIIMWSLLSGDFDPSISKEKCRDNIIKNAAPGSIIVFHDSEKSFSLMSYSLEETLKYFSAKGYSFDSLESAIL